MKFEILIVLDKEIEDFSIKNFYVKCKKQEFF